MKDPNRPIPPLFDPVPDPWKGPGQLWPGFPDLFWPEQDLGGGAA